MTLGPTFSIADMQPGVYRFDVLLDGNPLWRALFRITE